MQPENGIVHMEIWSEGLFTRPDKPNTLTCQSTSTNDTPRYPLHGPVTWNTARTRPNLCYIHLCVCAIGISADVIIAARRRHCVKKRPTDMSFIQHEHCHWHWKFCAGHPF